MSRLVVAWHGEDSRGEEGPGKAKQGKEISYSVSVRKDAAWLGLAGQGNAGHGKELLGMEWLGLVWRRVARQGKEIS